MNVSPPILQTKLHPPPLRADALPRARLLERLRDSPRLGQTLVLVSAPAGFGKTTLLCAWAAEEQLPFAWLALDEADNDPTRFWMHCIAALQTVAPGVGKTVLPQLLAPEPPPPEAIVTLVINDLAAHTETVRLVLDDYHLLTNDALHRALAFWLDHAPPNFQLALTTRADPSLPLARLRARGKMLELRADDLRCTADEAADFMNRAMGLTLSDAQVATLEKRTEGWIAGLQLAALSLRGARDAEQFIAAFTGSHRYVMDYLVDEVLAQQNERAQYFLLRTSVLERFNAALCDAVLRTADSAAQLAQLERANLFLVALDEAREWFRYHHLFAELLRHRLQKSDPALIPTLHLRASEWFAEHDAPAEAIDHAFAAQDEERAAQLLNEHIATFNSRGEQATVRRWLERLPAEWIARNPLLALAQAHAFIWQHDMERATACVEQAEHALALYPDAPWHDLARGQIARSRVYIGGFHQDLQTIEDIARHALEEISLTPGVRAEILQGLGLAYTAHQEHDRAAQAYADALEACRAGGEIYEPIVLYANQAETLLRQGRLTHALEKLEHALAHAAAHHLQELPVNAIVHETLADVYHKRYDLAQGELHVARARQLCAQAHWTRMLYYCVILSARFAVARGDFAQAQRELDDAHALAEKFALAPTVVKFSVITQVGLWLDTGKLDTAVKWAETRRADISPSELGPLRARVRVLLAQGNADAAMSLLTQLEALGAAQLSLESQISLASFFAVAHAAQQNHRAAMDALPRALALAEPEQFVYALAYTGAALHPLLIEYRAILEKHARPDDKAAHRLLEFTDRVLAALSNSPISPLQSPVSSLLSPPLTERETQVLQLMAQGMSNREISTRLHISIATVKKHSGLLFDKLGVKNRTEAVIRAQHDGLI
jgi:LuxR family maltose regulon positive regulatory protein